MDWGSSNENVHSEIERYDSSDGSEEHIKNSIRGATAPKSQDLL